MNIPGFTAETTLYSTKAHYYGGRPSMRAAVCVQPAQIQIFDPCFFGAHINVAWQPFHDGRQGVVIVTGNSFASRSSVRVRFDSCTSAFPELGFASTNACGEFTLLHTCTCSGPPIGVEALDGSGNSATGTVRQTC